MGFIDCDTHVLETEATWDYMDPSERHFRPAAVEFLPDNTPGQSKGIPINKTMWLVGDTFARLFPSDGRPGGYGKEYDEAVGFLTDPARRVQDMDLLGVDVHVVISTFFISVDIDHPLAEAAIARSWNRFAAERCAGGGGRLRWLVVPPTRMMDRAIAELEFGREHGAVGVMIKGYEHGLYLDDPYFYPLYEKAQDLDMPICIHSGASLRRVGDVPIGNLLRTQAAIVDHLGYVMKGMWAVVTSDLDRRFPRLRFAFLESGSTWVPTVFQQQQRLWSTSDADHYRTTSKGTTVDITKLPVAEMMEQKGIYVACESDEDLAYLTSMVGPNQLVFGSDYAHNDAGGDPLGHSLIVNRTDLAANVSRSIVDTNGRALFGIPADYRPADEALARSSAAKG
jgi:predicted TIM-barrel fold metal-dependent hydrolase